MDRQCSSCGGFCKKSGCERENVKPEHEPVAWGIANTRPTEKRPLMMVMLDKPEPSHLVVPLYAAPPPDSATHSADSAESFCKPEPVAWISHNAGLYHGKPDESLNPLPLYTAPQKKEWVGLTDEEYEAMAEHYVTNCYFDTLKYARAIEAKLKEKNT